MRPVERMPFTVPALATVLGIPIQQVLDVVANAPKYYRPFVRRIGGKARVIEAPRGLLRELQGRINDRLLAPFPFPDHLHGGIRNRSTVTNAIAHARSRQVVRIDVRDFFPSIRHGDVFRAWQGIGASHAVARILTKLTTLHRHVPVGAPTSTNIANLVLLPVDARVLEVCRQRGLAYTRFVDDLIISGDNPAAAMDDVILALRSAGFRVAREKMLVMGNHRAQVATGLNVNWTPSKPRYVRDRVRAAAHQLSAVIDCDEALEGAGRLAGRIADIRRTNPGPAARLDRELRRSMRIVQQCSAAATGGDEVPGPERANDQHARATVMTEYRGVSMRAGPHSV